MFMMGKLASKHLVAYYRMSERKNMESTIILDLIFIKNLLFL